jgi:hypothetical protein
MADLESIRRAKARIEEAAGSRQRAELRRIVQLAKLQGQASESGLIIPKRGLLLPAKPTA